VNIANYAKPKKLRIGLNESHIRKCSSKQVQLPEAMFQKETNELFAQGYLLLRLLHVNRFNKMH